MSSIPYYSLPSLPLGPITLQPFGILVATACLVGAYVIRREGDKREMDPDVIQSAIGWCLVAGFLGAHLFDVVAYQHDKIADDPLIIVKVWQGISSYGGFFGALVGFSIAMHKHKIVDRLAYADVIAIGLAPAWIFGRGGCAVVHDHIGTRTDFFLAIDFPSLGRRHDLGLYEVMFAVVLATVILVLARKRGRPSGTYIGLLCALYGPVRFGLDFLRRTDGANPDNRYFGLTPAHYLSLLTFAIGVMFLYWAHQNRKRGRLGGHLARAAEGAADAAPKPAAKTEANKRDANTEDTSKPKAAGTGGKRKKRKGGGKR